MGKPELTEELNRIEEAKKRINDLLNDLSFFNTCDNDILSAYYSLMATGTSNAVSYDSCGEIVDYYNSIIKGEEDRYLEAIEEMKDAKGKIDLGIEKLSEREREIREELDRIEAEEAALRKKGCLPVGVFKV